LAVAGNVTVNPAEVVLQKYPLPAVAVNPVVLTDCQACSSRSCKD
jgi:hypothetical protein